MNQRTKAMMNNVKPKAKACLDCRSFVKTAKDGGECWDSGAEMFGRRVYNAHKCLRFKR
jgi:hypothetical protein